MEMSEAAKEERRLYQRTWNANNRERNKVARVAYWENRAIKSKEKEQKAAREVTTDKQ